MVGGVICGMRSPEDLRGRHRDIDVEPEHAHAERHSRLGLVQVAEHARDPHRAAGVGISRRAQERPPVAGGHPGVMVGKLGRRRTAGGTVAYSF